MAVLRFNGWLLDTIARVVEYSIDKAAVNGSYPAERDLLGI